MDIVITIIFVISSTSFSLESRTINEPCHTWYEKNYIEKKIDGRYTMGYICGAVAPQ
jgi:hypothetical protein